MEYPQSTLPKMTPMRLDQQANPFDHPEWLFEVKFDGFRSLAYIDARVAHCGHLRQDQCLTELI